jgi:site-specific recombinase XerD
MEELARYYMRPLDTLNKEEVQDFLDELIQHRALQWATVNVYFSAYRLLYEQVLERSKKEFSIPKRGRSGKRPGILNKAEVKRLIYAPTNIKHRALLSITYGSGLRVSEVVRLRPHDLDSGRMMLRVEQAKGHKDRYTLLGAGPLELVNAYRELYRPENWLFFGFDRAKPMHPGTAMCIYNQALQKSGVRKVGGIHVLRHCFATHLMENGVDMYTIKKYMGHTSLTTTSRLSTPE